MKRLVLLLLVIGLCGWTVAEDKTEVQQRLEKAAQVLHDLAQAPDRGIPGEVLSRTKCIAVVPHMVKGGLGFGGEHGRGVATCRTPNGWSAPTFFTISGGSFGLQIGVEGVDLVMLAMNDKGMQALLSEKVELGGELSGAAGPVGRDARAGTDWKLNTPILTYSRTKGAFAGITINGAVIQRDVDSTVAFYGKDIPSKDLLTGNIPPPPAAKPFLETVDTITKASAAEHKDTAHEEALSQAFRFPRYS